jgi:hypothetical protein
MWTKMTRTRSFNVCVPEIQCKQVRKVDPDICGRRCFSKGSNVHMTVEIDKGKSWRLFNLAFTLMHSTRDAVTNEKLDR